MFSEADDSSLGGTEEDGIFTLVVCGTSVTWGDTDPDRLRSFFLGAVERLESRWPTGVIIPTDSDDGTETRVLRHRAHTKRVLVAFRSWGEYQSYPMDFEAASSSDLVLLDLRRRGTKMVATVQLNRVCNEAFATLSKFIAMRDVLVLRLACRSLSV